jgi:hypothetical protein
MKTITLSILSFFLLSCSGNTEGRNVSDAKNGGCSDATSSLEDGLKYAKKAYDADNLEELHDYARKAMKSASDAESYASDCKCNDAENAASDAAKYAKKAYNEDDFSDAQSYIKKARGYCDDALSAANDCK